MTLNTGIAGLGRWGQVLVDSVHNKSQKIHITAGCTGRKERARDYCATNGIDLRDSLEDLLADDALNAIILATPHSQHAEQIIACAKAGKHVFVEKPMTLTVAGAEAATAACRDAGVVCALGHNRRFLPAMARLREMATGGELGKLVHVESNISMPSGYRHGAEHWRTTVAESPAGGMTPLGIHMVDALISFLGPIAEVRASSERHVLETEVNDTTFMTFRYASGIAGTMTTITVTAPVWRIQVFGSAGWAEMRSHERLAWRMNDDAEETVVDFEPVDTMHLELEAFAEAVSGGAAYPLPIGEAVHGVAVLEAIIRACENGETVVV